MIFNRLNHARVSWKLLNCDGNSRSLLVSLHFFQNIRFELSSLFSLLERISCSNLIYYKHWWVQIFYVLMYNLISMFWVSVIMILRLLALSHTKVNAKVTCVKGYRSLILLNMKIIWLECIQGIIFSRICRLTI